RLAPYQRMGLGLRPSPAQRFSAGQNPGAATLQQPATRLRPHTNQDRSFPGASIPDALFKSAQDTQRPRPQQLAPEYRDQFDLEDIRQRIRHP
ncbi:MAG: hypothetical protein AAGG72_00455, partial [Pseudomonadota bacterium]